MSLELICESRQVTKYFWQYSVCAGATIKEANTHSLSELDHQISMAHCATNTRTVLRLGPNHYDHQITQRQEDVVT